MRQKFIKDTNKQYSIREDGMIIRHFTRYKYKTVYKDVETKGISHTINGVVKKYWHYYDRQHLVRKYSIQKLLADYLDIYLIGASSKLIIENRHEYIHPRIYKYPEDCITRKDKANYRGNIKAKRKIKNIVKSYAAKRMDMTVSEMPDDLYELYKAKLKLYRLIKSKKNENESYKLPTTHTCTV